MPLDATRARLLLKAFDFTVLFLEELGWDRQNGTLNVTVDERPFVLDAIAHKRGMAAYRCPTPAGERLPDYATRRRIEQQVTRSVHEHFIIYTGAEETIQIWQWVKREPGKPTACREHRFDREQSGDALIQKLAAIAFSLDEEERITLVEVTGRARAGFDVERVTKRFYEQFQKEHAAFLKFVAGIPDSADRAWYASAMLNRLMFVYFMQRKGFLDGDRDYLRNRLNQCRRERGEDRFYSFYRYFLLRLFHEGLGGRERSPELETLLGRIPYLNGGMFEKHPVEERYPDIQIPDQAFVTIFDYFDRYQWYLDERPLRNDNEINPDVLGYIFEKYINQKQMGAYYTREDITEYIGKNTIIPFLFDAARSKCSIAFENPDGPVVWDLLWADPDRYLYPAVRHGVDLALPPEIAAGLDTTQPNLLERRKGWNQPAPADHALPTEIWREVVARRTRCEAIRAKLAAGEVRDINELITLNLDLRQFARDVIADCEGPELLRAWWKAMGKVTVLDPTCGSGAFLFAALNILEPLYEACLERMAAFVAELDRSGVKHRPEKFSDFRQVLERVAAHPNRRYFILKNIILNNLFGVDIMEEATEICKLRLFLKLAAQVEPDPVRENLGIEPLPDIDFNIRAGNTLVGFATYEEVRKAVGGQLDFDNAMEKIEVRAADLQQTFDAFRQRQIEGDGSVPVEHKLELRKRLKALEDELNHYLAAQYGKNPNDPQWLKSHQPFHWFVEFYGIMKSGGFDVIIGNPPYIVNTPEKVSYQIKSTLFRTYSCKNLYAFIYEKSFMISHNNSSLGFIIQLTALTSQKMIPLQNILLERGLLIALSFPRRPESIFDGVEMPVTIMISRPHKVGLSTSRIGRFYTDERPHAFSTMVINNHLIRLNEYRIGKIGTQLEVSIIDKLNKSSCSLRYLTVTSSEYFLYYQEACRYWVKACVGYPFFKRNMIPMAPPHGRTIFFKNRKECAFACCLVNSTLFYWFYSVFSDCEHINDQIIRDLKIPDKWYKEDWISFQNRLDLSIVNNSKRKIISTKQGHKIEYDELDVSKSKIIIDEIDIALAQHYGFSDEELDFIINYDIKYRMGRDAGGEEG